MTLHLPGGEFCGYYRMVAHKVDRRGRIISSRVAADWFPNIITDAGLNGMGTLYLNGQLLDQFKVGSGTATPLATDTQLQTFIASTRTVQTSSSGMVPGPPRYAWVSYTKRFAAGAAAGNLTEVGVGQQATNTGVLFSRALIVDGAGNPTVVTILSDEVLDVSYELRRYIPSIADVPYSGLIIAGVSYSGVRRVADINTAETWYGYANTGTAGIRAFGGVTAGYNGLGPTNVANPLPGTTAYVNAGNLAYVSGSYQRDYSVTYDLNAANFPGGINALCVQDAYGMYQYSVTPSIPKTASKVLTLTFRCGPWGRYTP